MAGHYGYEMRLGLPSTYTNHAKPQDDKAIAQQPKPKLKEK